LVTTPFQAWVALGFVRRRLGLRYADLAAALWKSAVVAIATASAPLAAIAWLGVGFALSPLQGVAAGLLAVAAWGAALVLMRHPLFDEIARTIPSVRRTVLGPAE